MNIQLNLESNMLWPEVQNQTKYLNLRLTGGLERRGNNKIEL